MNLEDSLNATLAKEKEAKKNMNAMNARVLNSMKQKVKKSMKEYEKEVSVISMILPSQLRSSGTPPHLRTSELRTW